MLLRSPYLEPGPAAPFRYCLTICAFTASHNHLRNPLPTKRLAIHESLSPHSSKQVERRRDQQNNSRRDQRCDSCNDRQPLDQAHDTINSGAHIVRFEASDEVIEGCGGRADSEEERDLDEEDDEGADTVFMLAVDCWGRAGMCMQAYDGEQDNPVELEDVGYAQCEAEDYAEYAGPVCGR